MKRLLYLSFLTFLFLLLAAPWKTEAQPVQTENAEVELISENLSIKPGQSFWIGVRMDLRDGWYVYYRNPGDSGMPLMTEWMHDKDFSIGEIQWPYPLWIDVGAGLASYGYYGDVLLMMEATAPDDLEPGTEYTLKAEADYLICEKVCIPEYVDIELTLEVTDGEVEYSEKWLPYFTETRAKLPVELDFWNAEASVSEEGRYLIVELSTDAFDLPDYSEIIYFAKQEGEIENAAKPAFRVEGDRVIIEARKSSFKQDEFTRAWALIYNANGWDKSGDIKAITIDIDLNGENAAIVDAESPLSVFSGRFLIILGFAFIGGLILNLMPCVFPILSIKVMNFMQMSGHDSGEVKKHGFVFGIGVLLSFLVLAGLLLLLRAGGQELGWGFQLQTPAFIAFMTFLMFGLGLSLMGVFEIGSSLINVAGKAGSTDGLRGSFFSGILATVLATPCTAPFMGTALGVAITLPASTALMIFAMLGIGMAAPYVLLSSFPALLTYLPKPGAWMETFKQAMAFPLFATAIWLIWVFGQQAGVDGLTKLLVGLLFLSLGIWIIHRWNKYQISGRARIISRSIATILITGGFLFSASSQAITFDGDSATASADEYGITWEPFSQELVQQYREEGRSIFIDFTAAWCITCQVNKRVVFGSDRVRNKFDELDFVMVKADWTNRNPEISRAIDSFGRSGVPLNIIYSESLGEPMILPELLTPGIVLDALDRATEGETITLGN